jgi:hypothetical protein
MRYLALGVFSLGLSMAFGGAFFWGISVTVDQPRGKDHHSADCEHTNVPKPD